MSTATVALIIVGIFFVLLGIFLISIPISSNQKQGVSELFRGMFAVVGGGVIIFAAARSILIQRQMKKLLGNDYDSSI